MISNLSNMLARRDLVVELVRGELKATTAETRLGWLWWLLDPLIMMMIYWVIMTLILGRDRYAPYPIFVGCALLSWKHLSTAATSSVKVLRTRHGLIKAVPFPTMALPISTVLTQFIYFCFALIVLIVAAIAFGIPIGFEVVQLVPLMLLQVVLVTGVALSLACTGVLVRDLESVIGHVLRACWYLSPGIYGADLVFNRLRETEWVVSGDTLANLYMLNPAAILFTGYRAALHEPTWLEPWLWLALTIEAGLVLAIGYWLYQHFDRRVIKFI
jgi:ABC-type polysaccharide/polyol phosphate export permease